MKKILFILILTLSVSTSSLVWSKNYDNCILQSLQGVGSDIAATAIIKSCELKSRMDRGKEICIATETYTINNIIFLSNTSKPFTGQNICRYPSMDTIVLGPLKSQGEIKDGRKDGKWNWWSQQGQVGLEKNYKEGELDGKSIWWFQDVVGLFDLKKKKLQNYKEGKLDGKSTWWFKSGQMAFEKNYKEGELDGKSIWWFETKKDYESLQYSQIKKIINYKDGKLDGKSTWWFESINSEISTITDEVLIDNLDTIGFVNQIGLERNYKDGKLEGKSTWWFENGQKGLERNYKDNVCISGDCF